MILTSLPAAKDIPNGTLNSPMFIIRFEPLWVGMNEDEARGKGKQIKGKAREELGKLTNNKREQVKGKIEQAEGKSRAQIGKAERKNKQARSY
jgi:uncharacterized protein YjbJ (UPF0337 family)